MWWIGDAANTLLPVSQLGGGLLALSVRPSIDGAGHLPSLIFGLGAFGVSLLKRVREVVLGLPGLAAWQISEGRWAFTGRN